MNKKAKFRREIAEELGISYRTLNRLIEKHQLDIPGNSLLTHADYIKIYRVFFSDEKDWPA